MATPDYWAEAPMNREQAVLFSPTLDAVIAEDDPVRLFDEVLSAVDWSAWEAEYHGRRGQPAIHPRRMAGVLLYGMCRGIRSTRKLEEACCYRLDFIWLVEGRRIDHTTLSKFRTRFGEPLKDLFRQVGRIAMRLGLIRLETVAFDGTRVKANNGRHATGTAKRLKGELAELDARFDQMMAEFDAAEKSQTGLFAQGDSPTRLPEDLATVDGRRQKIRQALQAVEAADAARRRKGVDPEKKPAQVPTTDPESRVMPNKEGGFAPNYTPTATSDGHRGFVAHGDVTADVNESEQVAVAVDAIEKDFGRKPEQLLADAGNNGGQVIEAMEQRGVEFYAPAESNQPSEDNPARRADPTQPVPEAEWSKLPNNAAGQLDKSCFVYDRATDQYFCPAGHAMPFAKSKPVQRGGQRVNKRIYRCQRCDGCPLAGRCLSPKSRHGRTITRDQFEDARQRLATRMSTATARELSNQRPRIAETTFGILKSAMGIRQFLLRGLAKVRTEWRWACTAFNLAKLVREIGRLRARFEQLAATAEG